ncbi:Protein of unknown function [Gryllus bimaculatus]|nr:Protein of unknown function [Gryllus bimaculatus]
MVIFNLNCATNYTFLATTNVLILFLVLNCLSFQLQHKC